MILPALVAALSLLPGRVEVVTVSTAPTTRYAVQEFTNFVSQALGAPVPVGTQPTAGKVSVRIGEGPWSKDLDLVSLRRDGFYIGADADGVRLCGRDDPHPHATDSLALGNLGDAETYEMGSLYAVYAFLEDFVGCRFYFPGEIGTVVPRKDAVEVPEGVRRIEPAYSVRRVWARGDGAWYDGKTYRSNALVPGKVVNWLRLRLQTQDTPCCHGLNFFMLPERFGKDHPEYFQLRTDGTRCNQFTANVGDTKTRHLCHTSAVWDEIYRDVRSYLLGEGPEVRGMRRAWGKAGEFRWNGNCVGRRYVDLMSQDGMRKCVCGNCLSAYNDQTRNYATDLMWSNTVSVANRLSSEGIPGYVTQMAYLPYADIPKVDIPSNVLVMVSEGGPWGMGHPDTVAKQVAHVRKWYEKLGRQVWLWTYPMKQFSTDLPDIPQSAPRSVGRYFQSFSPMIFGAFLESESDKAIYNYQNYYVFSRLGWNPSADVAAILAEHDRLMFGAAAKEMRLFFDALEHAWIRKIAGREYWTSMGPVIRAASMTEIWSRVYSAKTLDRLEALLDQAAAKVPSGSSESKRVGFMRAQFFDPLAKRGRAFQEEVSVERELKRRAAAGADRSVVPGEFAEIAPWRVLGSAESAQIDRESFVSGESSLEITSKKLGAVYLDLQGRVKPNTRYRLSYFIKQDAVALPDTREGVAVKLCDTYTWTNCPKKAFLGSFGWLHQTCEWQTGDLRGKEPLRILLLLGNVMGKAWFDGVRLEEIGEVK